MGFCRENGRLPLFYLRARPPSKNKRKQRPWSPQPGRVLRADRKIPFEPGGAGGSQCGSAFSTRQSVLGSVNPKVKLGSLQETSSNKCHPNGLKGGFPSPKFFLVLRSHTMLTLRHPLKSKKKDRWVSFPAAAQPGAKGPVLPENTAPHAPRPVPRVSLQINRGNCFSSCGDGLGFMRFHPLHLPSGFCPRAFTWLTLEGEQTSIFFSSSVVGFQPLSHNKQNMCKLFSNNNRLLQKQMQKRSRFPQNVKM